MVKKKISACDKFAAYLTVRTLNENFTIFNSCEMNCKGNFIPVVLLSLCNLLTSRINYKSREYAKVPF